MWFNLLKKMLTISILRDLAKSKRLTAEPKRLCLSRSGEYPELGRVTDGTLS
jgi:hypothetical protein